MENTVTLQAVVGAIRTSGEASRKRGKKAVGRGRTPGIYASKGNIYSDFWAMYEKRAWDAVNAKLASKGLRVENYDGQKIVVAA
jgi:hypothetical protein